MQSQSQSQSQSQATVRRRRLPPSRRRKDGLIRHASDSTSQNGEDGILAHIFELLPPPPPPCVYRCCVDVGAWDGVHLSNTHSLLVRNNDVGVHAGVHAHVHAHASAPADTCDCDAAATVAAGGDGDATTVSCGCQDRDRSCSRSHDPGCPDARTIDEGVPVPWRGVLIEADPTRFADLARLHEPLGNVCINAHVSCREGGPLSLSSLLQRHTSTGIGIGRDSGGGVSQSQPSRSSSPSPSKSWSLPLDLDLIVIDVDGPDYWLLHDVLSRGYRPKVVCVEFNPTIPHDVVYIQARDDDVGQGSSLAALVELAEANDYILVETTLYNAFFVPRPLYRQYLAEEVPEPTIEALHDCTMGTSLYQLYDGTIKLAGCKKLLWHRKPMNEDDMQVLEPRDRRFPFAPPPTPTSRTLDDDHDEDAIGVGAPIDPDEGLDCGAVDVSPYFIPPSSCGDDIGAARAEAARALVQSLRDNDGFAVVKGTGLSRQLCRDALGATRDFFAAPEVVKKSCLSATDRARRGYSPPNSENFASLVGERGPNDLVRKFRVGPPSRPRPRSPIADVGGTGAVEVAATNTNKEGRRSNGNTLSGGGACGPGTAPSSPLLRDNVWPSPSSWGGDDASRFRTSVEAYYVGTCRASHSIVRCIADGLIQLIREREVRGRAKHVGDGHPCDECEGGEALGALSEDPLRVLLSMDDANHSDDCDGIDDGAVATGAPSHTSILTLLGYSKGARHHAKRGKKGSQVTSGLRPLVAPHTDVGILTVLLFDGGDCAMLQRRRSGRSTNTTDGAGASDENNAASGEITTTTAGGGGASTKNDPDSGDWVNVRLPQPLPDDPCLVINVGDCLAELSGGTLKSPLHRVVPQPGPGGNNYTPRHCLALFVGLEPSARLIVPSLATAAAEEQGSVNGNWSESLTYEEWRRRRIARAASVIRKKE